MSRQLLLEDLERYQQAWGENPELERYRRFVLETPDCCQRTHLAGHCTGSALICDPDGPHILLLFHPKLQRWLQPGGHADGDFDLLRVAHREAFEETGLPPQALKPCSVGGRGRVPLDLDIHPIPARGHEPAHQHYDLRYLLLTQREHPLNPESPDLELRWLPAEEVETLTSEESVLRMVRKLKQLDLTQEAGNPLGTPL